MPSNGRWDLIRRLKVKRLKISEIPTLKNSVGFQCFRIRKKLTNRTGMGARAALYLGLTLFPLLYFIQVN